MELLLARPASVSRAIMVGMTIAGSSVLTATNSFNSDFYVAIATLIPVLFLALTFQSPPFVRVFRAYQRSGHTYAGEQHAGSLVAGIFTAASVLVLLFFSGIVIAGVLGELLAVYALYQRQDQSGTRQVVLASTMILIIAVGAVSVASFMGGMVSTRPQSAHAALSTKAQQQEGESAGEDTELSAGNADITSDAEPGQDKRMAGG